MAIIPFRGLLGSTRNVSKRIMKQRLQKGAKTGQFRPGDTTRKSKPGGKGKISVGKGEGKLFKKEEDLLFGKGQKTRRGRKARRKQGL